MKLLTIFSFILFLVSCKEQTEKPVKLGSIDFEVTGKQTAIPHFERGLLLLHSFEYEDARLAFLEAQEFDKNMAMAYWGEAMTYNHGLWREQDYEDGILALQKLEEVDLGHLTDVEKDLLQAVHILYEAKTPKKERDKNYSDHMKALYDRYPDQNEIASFYALSLLGSVSEGRNDSIYGMGAQVANKVLAQNAQHPGALHYLIHSYDDPYHAHLALGAADAYAKVAPDASHALHMPSHIYVALGMWDKVVASNIDSYQASLTRMETKDLDNDARGYHAFHWLQYGYLQQGNLEEAEKMVWDMKQFCDEKTSKRAKAHLLFLKGTYLAETGLWENPIANIEIDISGFNIAVKAQNYFIEGMKVFKAKNREVLGKVISDLESEIKKEALLVENLSNGGSLCASADRSIPNNMDVKRAEVVKTQLMGLQAWLRKDLIVAESFFNESVDLENEVTYSYGPPNILVPTKELYADFLLKQGRPEEAKIRYEEALKRGTKRRLPLLGVENSDTLINKSKVGGNVI